MRLTCLITVSDFLKLRRLSFSVIIAIKVYVVSAFFNGIISRRPTLVLAGIVLFVRRSARPLIALLFTLKNDLDLYQ